VKWSDTPNPFAMTAEEITAFLEEPWFAAVASLRRDGSPLIVYVGYEWDGEAVYFSVRSTRLLCKRIAHDPRVCFSVTNTGYPPQFVTMQGTAEIIEDPGFERTKRIARRYIASDSPVMNAELDLEEFWNVYTAVGRTVFRVKPDSIITEHAGKGDGAYGAGGGGTVSDAYARMRGELPD
jgi:PPOX class probable F420-dependent enzyme